MHLGFRGFLRRHFRVKFKRILMVIFWYRSRFQWCFSCHCLSRWRTGEGMRRRMNKDRRWKWGGVKGNRRVQSKTWKTLNEMSPLPLWSLALLCESAIGLSRKGGQGDDGDQMKVTVTVNEEGRKTEKTMEPNGKRWGTEAGEGRMREEHPFC